MTSEHSAQPITCAWSSWLIGPKRNAVISSSSYLHREAFMHAPSLSRVSRHESSLRAFVVRDTAAVECCPPSVQSGQRFLCGSRLPHRPARAVRDPALSIAQMLAASQPDPRELPMIQG